MIYAALWRALPGPRPVKALLALLLFVGVVAVLFLWVFPRVAALMPFNDNTVQTAPPAVSAPVRPGGAA